MQRDAQCVILRQSIRGSVRAIRANRNARVFQTEIRVVAEDASLNWRILQLPDTVVVSRYASMWDF